MTSVNEVRTTHETGERADLSNIGSIALEQRSLLASLFASLDFSTNFAIAVSTDLAVLRSARCQISGNCTDINC